LIIAGAATPIVLLVYGSAWAESAQVLPWLAVMAIFRIFFELAYDFLVVLGRSVSILTTQLVWVTVLIPSLLVAANLWGLTGLAAMQVAVAGLVVAPMYLFHFNRSGLSPVQVGARVWLPVVIGLIAGSMCLLTSTKVTSSLLACVIAGTIGLVTVGLLIHGDRHELAKLRTMGTQ
jgi:PST family polysaccharide transporter